MKKSICLLLVLCCFLPILTACSCTHEYENGVCKKCEEACVHAYENGVCTVCSVACQHSYENGTCKTCSMGCAHTYESGVCTVCSMACQHTYENGKCTSCGLLCAHTFQNDRCSICGIEVCKIHDLEKGICKVCGTIRVSGEDLKGRSYEFAYYEFAWAENATEQEKSFVRKQFGNQSDEELFATILNEYRANQTLLVGGQKGQKYYFSSTQKVKVYDSALESSKSETCSYTCSFNRISIKGEDTENIFVGTIKGRNETFYYEGDRICKVEDSEYRGVSLKTVFYEFDE